MCADERVKVVASAMVSKGIMIINMDGLFCLSQAPDNVIIARLLRLWASGRVPLASGAMAPPSAVLCVKISTSGLLLLVLATKISRWALLVSRCFEPRQPLGDTSGLCWWDKPQDWNLWSWCAAAKMAGDTVRWSCDECSSTQVYKCVQMVALTLSGDRVMSVVVHRSTSVCKWLHWHHVLLANIMGKL